MGQFQDELRNALIACRHYGDYQLSSGGRAREYYDLAPLLLSPKGLRMISHEVMNAFNVKEFGALGCVELCPVPLVGAVLSLTLLPLHGFVVRKVKKGHGTDRLIEGTLKPGDRVALLEDVTSTGQSVLKAIRVVEAHGCTITCILTIVNRQEGCDELLRPYNFRWLFTKGELEV